MSDFNDQGGVKRPGGIIASLCARLAESERLRADDIEILTGDVRRRDKLINTLRKDIDTLRECMEQDIVKLRKRGDENERLRGLAAEHAADMEREVDRLTHAARLVIREHNCGDIDACYVCGPLEAALTAPAAPKEER